MNKTILRKIFSDKKVKRYVGAGNITKAVEAAVEVMTSDLPKDFDLVVSLIDRAKTADGVFLPSRVKQGSPMYKNLVEYTQALSETYLTLAERYVMDVDKPFPLSKEDLYYTMIMWAKEASHRVRLWNVNNLHSDTSWEEVNYKLSEKYIVLANPNKELLAFFIKEFRAKMGYTLEILSDDSKQARMIRFMELLSKEFKIPMDSPKFRGMLTMATLVAKQSFLEVHGQFHPDNEYMRLGYLCGRDLEDGNTAFRRIKDAIIAHMKTTQPQEKPKAQAADAFDL